jgi:UTP--glucose-1-phosphate uridylyltransferase
VLGVQNVPKQDTDKYGIVTLERKVAPRIGKMSHIVEKPKPDKAASTLAVVGRYLLTPSIFDDLSKIGKGAGGEIQLTDGIAQLMQREPVYAFEFEGKRYDCGSKFGYLQATVEYGLKHPSLGGDFASYLRSLVSKLP